MCVSVLINKTPLQYILIFYITGPRIALCLPVPFNQEKLRTLGISQKLASFLLYALSPFLPNQDILDNSEMIAALTHEFRQVDCYQVNIIIILRLIWLP